MCVFILLINQKLDYSTDILSVQSSSFGNIGIQNTNGKKKRQTRQVALAFSMLIEKAFHIVHSFSSQISCDATINGSIQGANKYYYLGIGFYINKCPKTKCITSYCIHKCASEIESEIQSKLTLIAFPLTIETTDGAVLLISVQFCFLGQVASGKRDKSKRISLSSDDTNVKYEDRD